MQRGAEVPRETLADLFWGNNTDDLARQSLRQALVGLRRLLAPIDPEALCISRDTVSLREASVAVERKTNDLDGRTVTDPRGFLRWSRSF